MFRNLLVEQIKKLVNFNFSQNFTSPILNNASIFGFTIYRHFKQTNFNLKKIDEMFVLFQLIGINNFFFMS